MISTGTKIVMLSKHLDSAALSDWENTLIKKYKRLTHSGQEVGKLTPSQIISLELLYSKYFN